MNPVLIGVLAYVFVQLLIGILVSRSIKTEDDYLVAGRRLGMPLVACSVFATWFGAETCVGAAGEIYRDGIGRTSVEPFAYGICLVLTGLLFVTPFWKRRITTLADFFRMRFSATTERLAAVLLIPTSVLWAAAQVRAFGHVLATSSSMSVELAIAIAAGIAIIYTVFGGLLADVITDFVQGGALVLGLAVLLVAVVNDLGPEALSAIEPGRIRFFGDGVPGWMETIEAWAIPICGSLTAQEVISRALAARSPRVARNSTILGGGVYLLVGLMPVYLGLVAARWVPDMDDPEQVLPALALIHLPTFLYILFAGALVSAILSTVDSALLVASSLLSRNLVLSFGKEVGQKRRIFYARGGVVLFGLMAWYFAVQADGVFALVEEASGFGSAGVLVVVVMGLVTKWGGTRAALLSPRFQEEEMAYPYLFSLLCAVVGYVSGAVWDGRTSRVQPA